MIPNVLDIGEPGSGKSVAAARDALSFPGAKVILDPHKDSLAQLVLTHATGEILYDRIDDLDHPLGYGLLEIPTHPDPRKQAQSIQKKVNLFVEVLMRRRGGDIAGSPLMEEWITALLMLFFHQRRPLPPAVLPFGFVPGTDEFEALVEGTTLPELKAKFRALEKLPPRALRAEVGSASRFINVVFRNPEFLARCGGGGALVALLRRGGTFILERGDADEDVTRTIIGGINLLVTDYCEGREKPFPPVAICLDECTNARTAGPFEEKKAGETRKYGLHWRFICQHPNFPNGPEGFFQNCQEKHFYRTGDHTLARKLAAFVVGGMERGEDSRAAMIDDVVRELMTFKPGWRYVVGPRGTRKEYVPMLENPWPDWPGLRKAKLLEKLCRIHARPEYRIEERPPSGAPAVSESTTSREDTPSRPNSSAGSSSPAERWQRERRRRTGGS